MSDLMKSVLLIGAVAVVSIVGVNYASNKSPTVKKLVNPG